MNDVASSGDLESRLRALGAQRYHNLHPFHRRRDSARDKNRLPALTVAATRSRIDAPSIIHKWGRADPVQYSVIGVNTPCCDRE